VIALPAPFPFGIPFALLLGIPLGIPLALRGQGMFTIPFPYPLKPGILVAR